MVSVGDKRVRATRMGWEMDDVISLLFSAVTDVANGQEMY